MKKILLTLAVLTAVFGMESRLQAAFIVGQQAYSADATTSTTGSINDTDFDISFVTNAGGSNQTGDFIGTFGAFINSLDTTAAAGFVFGDATYGTFVVDTVNVNDLIAGVSRTLNFSGTFTPGAATFGPGFDPTLAELSLTINQASPGVLSASATLATVIPEPSTIVLLGTFCGTLGIGWIRRRRLAQNSS